MLTIALLIFSITTMLFPVIPLFLKEINIESSLILAFIFTFLGFLLWIVFAARYEITEFHVIYYTGPIKGKIEISSIHTIISGKTLWVGNKPATATKGLILEYGKYDRIYISPETNETFIEAILKIKPNIKIIEN